MKAVHRFLIISLGLMFIVGFAPAQITSAASGNWNSTATWTGGVVPSAADNVVIGHTVDINIAGAECNDLTVNSTLQFPLSTTGYSITVHGNVTVATGGRFRIASSSGVTGQYIHTVELKKNLSIVSVTNGAFDMRSASGANGTVGRVIFSGSENSTISLTLTDHNSSREEFNYVQINKTGGAKVILAAGNLFMSNNGTNMPDSLDLTSGIIETGTNKWIILRTAGRGVYGGSSTSYVNGILGLGVSNSATANVNLTFPVGDAAGYRPISLTLNTNVNQTGHHMWVKAVSGNANTGSSTLNDGLQSVSAVRYHEIGYVKSVTPQSADTIAVVSLTESYGADDGVGASNTDLRVAYSSNARVTWGALGQTSAHTTDLSSPPTTITPDAFLSHFILGNGTSMFTALGSLNTGTNPLPVQLTGFSAAADLRGATLTWKTASEVDNAGFEVERRMISNRELSIANYSRVGFVAGHGTSTSEQSYSFTDNAAPGRYAYRLKQIDRDGSSKYSGEVEVVIGLAPRALTLGSYPNPFNPSTTIDFTLPEDGLASVRVFNLLGQEVATLFSGQATAGRLYQVPFDASRLMSGVYVARLETSGQVAVTKLTVMK